ncbi:hypothetical protein MIR68_000906 [Amoeboaphelidium protococcarum]|nr:hypothetical protein MIR68_000906 [Amoeboaphelidium protococcarum]
MILAQQLFLGSCVSLAFLALTLVCWYVFYLLIVQQIKLRALFKNKFDLLLIIYLISTTAYCSIKYSSLVDYQQNLLSIRSIEAVCLAVLVVCYIQIIFLRSDAILQFTSYYRLTKIVLWICTILFALYPAFQIAYSVLQKQYIVYFLQAVHIALADLAMIVLEIIYTVGLSNYLRKIQKSFKSPNATIFAIISKYGIVSLVMVLTGGVLGAVTSFVSGLLSMVLYSIICLSFVLVGLTLVFMKVAINNYQRQMSLKATLPMSSNNNQSSDKGCIASNSIQNTASTKSTLMNSDETDHRVSQISSNNNNGTESQV